VTKQYNLTDGQRSALQAMLTRRKNTEPLGLHVAWGFRLRGIKWCDRHLCHMTITDHT